MRSQTSGHHADAWTIARGATDPIIHSSRCEVMFKIPNGVFEKIECPDLLDVGECKVSNCIFRHEAPKRKLQQESSEQKRQKVDPSTRSNAEAQTIAVKKEPSAPEIESTPVKRDVSFVVPRELPNKGDIPRPYRFEMTRKIAKFLLTKKDETPNLSAIEKEFAIASSCKSNDEYRQKTQEFLGIRNTEAPQTDPKFVNPIEVIPSPALLPVRRKYAELMAEAIKRTMPELKTPILKALEEEYKLASTNSSTTYNLAAKRKIYEFNHPEKVTRQPSKGYTKSEYITALRELCISREKLVKFGFIMDKPGKIESPEHVRQCHRCKNEFKLTDAAKVVDCKYHPGRLIKNDQRERFYSCCNGILGATDTVPCESSKHHVFYWSGPEEMNHFLPFLNTRESWGSKKGSLEAVGIDCEMGFTTKGFELLRITAVDFFSGEDVLDVLVRPKGEVLDLNTKWSGVAEIKDEALTFESSIELLGELLDANTVMVGHGLENDMNAMRLIHDKIVDTAVLYPKHKATPTFRFSLKQLAFQFLSRNIQIGEHDSGEDSLAAIDVTKYFIEQDLERKRSQR